MSLKLLPGGDGAADDPGRRTRHFVALADAIAEILFVTTPDGRALAMPDWQELTGQTAAQVAGYGWLDTLHPDDVAGTTALWQQALATRRPYRANYRIRDRAGAYRWYQARAAPVFDDAGILLEWVGVCLDIEDWKQAETERELHAAAVRASEQRFRTLVRSVAAVVWLCPKSGRFEAPQPDWEAFTGQSFAEHAGDGWLDAVHPEDRAETSAAWMLSYNTNSHYEVEHRLRRADGTYVPTVARATPILEPGTGEVREWIGFHTDQSHLRRVERELRLLTTELEHRVERRTAETLVAQDALRRANENLEATVATRTAALTAANEEVQRFAYIVSHDLRAPLVNIMGFANELRVAREELIDLLATLDPPSRAALGDAPARLATEISESLDFILQSTGKMDRLIGAILRLSREGRRAFTPEPVSLDEVFAAIVGSLAHQCAERDAAIALPAELPTLVIDRVTVEQILTNLVENAVKYLEPGRPGRIRVTAPPSDHPHEVALAIADNGRGIAQRDLGRVFDLFRRAGRQDQPGEGIGLAFVRAQVRRLGGRIEVTSVEREGTTFTLTLPREARG